MPFSFGSAAGGAIAGSSFGPIGTAAGGILGGLFGGSDNSRDAASAQAANELSIAEAQKNRDFQERMSSTAHQREVKDLIAAGLNPMLSVNSGSSTPSGSMSSTSNTRLGISDRNIQRQINSASIAKLVADTALSRESAATQRTQQEVNSANAANLRGNVNILGVHAPLSRIRSAASNAWNSAKSWASSTFPNTFGSGGTPGWVRSLHRS